MEPDKLTISEEAWCSFMDEWTAKGITSQPHPETAFSAGFRTGEKTERDRLRQELEHWMDITGIPEDGAEIIRVKDLRKALKRICAGE